MLALIRVVLAYTRKKIPMKNFRKIAAVAAASLLALSACSSDEATSGSTSSSGEVVTVKVGASPVPHAQILQFVQDNLAADAGINIEILEYTDYIQPNVALDQGEIDANFFQTPNYLESEEAEKGYDFTAGKGVHIEPQGIYSEKWESVEEIPDGATILLNNDPANQTRGLRILEQAGLITLPTDNETPTIFDVTDNPKNFEFLDADGAVIPLQLGDVDAAVINGNYALEHDLDPATDSIFLEEAKDSPYANLLVWKTDTDPAKADAVAKLEELLHDPSVADFIRETYPNGAVVPAF